jgi:hypothetical protein
MKEIAKIRKYKTKNSKERAYISIVPNVNILPRDKDT